MGRIPKLKILGYASAIACTLLSGCVTWNRGLEPVEPKYGAYSWSEKVDTLTPRLAWSPYKGDSGKQDFRYQLQIIDGNVVRLFKDGIHDTFYVVEESLQPNKEYQWHVRAAWTVNGKTEGEDWNSKGYFYLSPILFGWGGKNYTLKTPEKPVAVAEQPKVAIVVDSDKKNDTLKSTIPLSTNETSVRDDSLQLEKIKSLKDRGIISDEDYNKKKAEILDRM